MIVIVMEKLIDCLHDLFYLIFDFSIKRFDKRIDWMNDWLTDSKARMKMNEERVTYPDGPGNQAGRT